MVSKEIINLIEKIVRAKVKLEGLKKDHSITCTSEQEFGSCNCGAEENNEKIDSILDDLSLLDDLSSE